LPSIQGPESILGPIQQIGNPSAIVGPPDPIEEEELQQQALTQEQEKEREEQRLAEAQSEKEREQQGLAEAQGQEKDKKSEDSDEDSDDGSVDAALGLINTGPVQLKNDLEQPVTSGGMDTMTEIPNPGSSN
jgi:hypothetical protein